MSVRLYLPAGFAFSAVAAGIKQSGRPDLAFAECELGASAAAVFTRNRVAAAPVVVGRRNLQSARGRVRALIVNSGNANCATGEQGTFACKAVCKETARLAGIRSELVFPSSTGIIGVQLPAQRIINSLPALIHKRAATLAAARQFADAILTTDTRAKLAAARFTVRGAPVALLGIAKGSGMIHPDLATMLVYLFTDLVASPRELRTLLRSAANKTFNCISVDGDTSTNDTVLLLASGASGVPLKGARPRFQKALLRVCESLAGEIVSDGEGAKHVVTLKVEEARNMEEARKIAQALARSLLVKTALAGADPNWGRVLAAIGAAGVRLDPSTISLYFGRISVCKNGAAVKFNAAAAHAYLLRPAYEIRVTLGRGQRNLKYLTTDLTEEYVRINAEYST